MKVEVYKDLQQRIPEVRSGTRLGLLPAHAPSTPPLTAPPHPLQRIVEKAVVGMLPKNSYGRELFRHLKVYKGAAHPHEAQTPEPLTFTGLTSEPDSRVLDLQDPDAMFCATD